MNGRMCRTGFLLIFMALTSGCASTLSVTYLTDPPGAVLYQGDQRFGYTPTTLNYQVTDEARKRGYMLLQGTSVRWASGASAEISSLRADLSIGLNQQFNFIRPENYPGREEDMRFSLEIERLSIQRRQAVAQENQAIFQLYNAINQQNQRQLVLPQPVRQPVRNCTSTVIGNTVHTTCY